MAQIEPLSFPIVGDAEILEVTVGAFKTNALSANTYYELNKSDGSNCIKGNYHMTEEQFAAWGQDNSIVEQYVASYLGVTIIGPTPPEVIEP